MRRSTVRTLLLAALMAAGMSAAQAAPVTLDFSSGTGDNLYTYDEDGFRVRAQAGDHFENNYSGEGWFSWHDGSANAAPNILRIDFANGSGAAFAALEVDLINVPVGTGGIVFRDSNGNSVIGTAPGVLALNFLSTTYLEFQIVNAGQDNSFPVSIDNLDLNTVPVNAVPEPGSMALVGLALLGLGLNRRRSS